MLRVFGVACLLLALSGCGKPSAAEMRDFLGKMPDSKSTTATRGELIENIGYEPDEIRDSDKDCEVWIWKLKGGDVEMLVCAVGGKFIAHNLVFAPED